MHRQPFAEVESGNTERQADQDEMGLADSI